MKTALQHQQDMKNANERLASAAEVVQAYKVARDRRRSAYQGTRTTADPFGSAAHYGAWRAAEVQLDAAYVTYNDALTARNALRAAGAPK